MSSPTSKSRMGECGCSPTASSGSQATCLSRRKKSYGQLTLRQLRTCSHRSLPGVAWRSKLNSYIVATNDRTVQPKLQRFLAKRMGATTTEVASSHVPMLSNPKLVIDVIRAAAKAVQETMAAA